MGMLRVSPGARCLRPRSSRLAPSSVQPVPTQGWDAARSILPHPKVGRTPVGFAQGDRLGGAQGRVVQAAEERFHVLAARALPADSFPHCQQEKTHARTSLWITAGDVRRWARPVAPMSTQLCPHSSSALGHPGSFQPPRGLGSGRSELTCQPHVADKVRPVAGPRASPPRSACALPCRPPWPGAGERGQTCAACGALARLVLAVPARSLPGMAVPKWPSH